MITLQAHGDGGAKMWAGAYGYEWTIHASGPLTAVGTLLSIRFTVQLECSPRSFELGPVVTTPIVQLAAQGDRAFARFNVVAPITREQVQEIEVARNGGAIPVRLQPWLELAAPPINGALSAVDVGRSDQDGAWWRRALDAWQWGSSIVQIVRRPGQPTDSSWTSAYDRLLRAQTKVRSGDYRGSVMEVRGVFEILRSVPRPGDANGPARSVNERWWDLTPDPKIAFDIASAAAHDDGAVRDHLWSRSEAEALVAIAAAMLNVAMG